ncbi:MAG: sigma-70 family RNA polymerase sigma factor [Alistipes sp.]|nr:sigma-70 family RNA polymerase sigma factor [Alistipes sp.]
MERLVGFSYSDEEVREVVVHLYPRMIAYIRKMLGGRDLSITAEDVFQSAICTFLEKRPLISRDKVSAYIARIVRNDLLNRLTRNSVENHTVNVDFRQASAMDVLFAAEGGEERVVELDSVAVSDIVNFSESFSPRMREVFYLSRVKCLTHREIAEQLGISTRMVERYLAQSVALYRQHFDWSRDGEIFS